MGNITVLGVGFDTDSLTLGAIRELKSGKTIVLHTEKCALAKWLTENDMAYIALDYLYETTEDFSEHTDMAVDRVMEIANNGDILYCVFDLRDLSAQKLIQNGAKAIAGVCAEGELMGYLTDDALIASSYDLLDARIDASRDTLVREIDSPALASDVKIKLMEAYPDDAKVILRKPDGSISVIELNELDRLRLYSHKVSALIKREGNAEKRSSLQSEDIMTIVGRDKETYHQREYDEVVKLALELFGAVKYAQDRGEFTLSEVFCDAYSNIMYDNGKN